MFHYYQLWTWADGFCGHGSLMFSNHRVNKKPVLSVNNMWWQVHWQFFTASMLVTMSPNLKTEHGWWPVFGHIISQFRESMNLSSLGPISPQIIEMVVSVENLMSVEACSVYIWMALAIVIPSSLFQLSVLDFSSPYFSGNNIAQTEDWRTNYDWVDPFPVLQEHRWRKVSSPCLLSYLYTQLSLTSSDSHLYVESIVSLPLLIDPFSDLLQLMLSVLIHPPTSDSKGLMKLCITSPFQAIQ